MQIQLSRLKERASIFGNYQQKFIRTIEKYSDPLINRLEEKGCIDDVHLWKFSNNLSHEMDIIYDSATSDQEKVAFLGCYYALQILHLNLRSIDVLRLNLTRNEERISIYKNFMLDVGYHFRTLNATYMQKLLNLLSNSTDLPEYVISSVGSLAHQDDIDIGIIDDGSKQRTEFNKVIGQLRQYMYKWALEMHMFLSEHVGEQNYSASIDEYRQVLDREIGDFVIISEMLMAVPILGSKSLFNEFERKVTQRYYYHPNRDNKYHEGYLRGILGEVRALLIRQISPDMLSPKDDALRMLMGMILAGRTVFRVYHGNRWDVLAVLKERDSARKELYQYLENSVTFIETFLHLYQLFVGPEEEIYLDDPAVIEQMEIVAKTMGYEDVGAIKAWDHLLIHYHEYVQLAKEAALQILDNVTDHLKTITIFTSMIDGAYGKDNLRTYKGNLAIDFLKQSKFFIGTRFWDDIIEALSAPGSQLLKNFIHDLRLLKPSQQDFVIQKYGEASNKAYYPLISFLVILARNKRNLKCHDLFIKLNKAFLDHISKQEDRIVRLIKVFHSFPKVINDYLMTLEAEDQARLFKIIEGDLWGKEDIITKAKFDQLFQLHYMTSHYFKRFFVRVIDNYPEYIQILRDTEILKQIAKGLLGSIDNLFSFDHKKKQLGIYYDLEFLRVGLETIQGAAIEKISAEFTEFSDTYLQMLFDICRQHVAEEIGETIPTRDLFAIYTAGGHAREQAFDDDYDIMIFLNDVSPDLKKYINDIVTKMNAEIIKRGTMPQYRFADHFGGFVTIVGELDDYFKTHSQETFIDKSQILGSRLIVGSTKFEKEFRKRIIDPHIFQKNEHYIQQMISELQERHAHQRKASSTSQNIKEDIGGLRDIEMVLLMYKAKYKLYTPINHTLFETLYSVAPDCRNEFGIFQEAITFLKRLRDIYRLTVAAEDDVNVEYLDRVAHVMGLRNTQQLTAAQQLISDYQNCTKKVTHAVDNLIRKLSR
jgi:hypothetical protein